MMTEHRSTVWTARGALALATLALGVSTWGAGCRERRTETEKAAPPSVSTVTVPKPTEPSSAIVPVSTARQLPAEAPVQKAKAAPVAAEALRVKRLVLTHAIEKREPAPATELSLGSGPIMAFLELGNASDREETVEVSFERGDKSVGHVKLSVPAQTKRWRTWGQSRNVREAGEWQAVVRSSSGVELARASFTVSGG